MANECSIKVSDMDRPTVSIVVCTYNGEKYIAEQIDSLIRQTYPIKEIIIQDDCSSDNTLEICHDFRLKFPKLIQVISNPQRLGWNQNFYSAMDKVGGVDYIALCDQDDIWESTKIEKQVESLIHSKKQIHICSSNEWRVCNCHDILSPRYSEPGTLGLNILYPLYCGHQMLLSSSMKQFTAVGASIDMAHDRFFSLVGAYLDEIETSKELLVMWRRHEASITGHPQLDNSGVPGKKKITHALKNLSILGGHRKSPVLSRGLGKYYSVIKYLSVHFGSYPNSNNLTRLLNTLQNQTILGYLRAGLYLYHNRDEFPWKRPKGIKGFYGDITFFLRFWTIHEFDI